MASDRSAPGIRPPVTLAVIMLLICLLAGTAPALAQFFTVTDVPSSIPQDLPFGQTLKEVRIEGNTYTREKVILQAMKSKIGHPYTQENARLDVLWILRLGAFTSVELGSESVDDGMALIIIVAESTPYIPSLSIALTQENGVEIGPAFSSSNLLGTAARVSAYARFGGATNMGIKYSDPILPIMSFLNGYRFEYFHRERRNELMDFDETTDEFFLEFLQSTTDETRTGLRFSYIALKSDLDDITLGGDNYDHIPSLGFFLQSDSRNSIYPTEGWYTDIAASKWGVFGGDADYWRLDVDVRHYLSLNFIGQRHSLAFSSYASLINGELGVTVPQHQEFFVGGTNSVRGWSLGSRRGRNQWLTTLEYWFKIMEQKRWKLWFIKWRMGVQIGAFGDMGTAWSDPEELEGNMIAGAGAGLRLTLPVVTLFRMDLAYGEGGATVRLFIGGAEKAEAQKKRVR